MQVPKGRDQVSGGVSVPRRHATPVANVKHMQVPKGRDHVSGGVSVPCRHATPVAKNNLILRKMYIAGLEHKIPDSTGQCANHCAMEDLKLERVFVLFIDSRYL